MICFVPFGFMAFLYILCGIAFVTVIVVGGVAAVRYLRQSRRPEKPWTAQSGCKPLTT